MNPAEKLRRKVAQKVLDQMNRIYTDDLTEDRAFEEAHKIAIDAVRKALLEWIRIESY